MIKLHFFEDIIQSRDKLFPGVLKALFNCPWVSYVSVHRHWSQVMLLATHCFWKYWPCSLSEDSGSLVYSCTGLSHAETWFLWGWGHYLSFVRIEWHGGPAQHLGSISCPMIVFALSWPTSTFLLLTLKRQQHTVLFLISLEIWVLEYLHCEELKFFHPGSWDVERHKWKIYPKGVRKRKSSEVHSLKNSQNHIQFWTFFSQFWCWSLVKSLCASGLKKPVNVW